MEEDKKSDDGVLENLALLTDGIQTLFPEGKVICVFELNDDDFKKVQSNFRKIDSGFKKFSIDMSGVEHVFIHEELANQVFNVVVEPTPEPITISPWKRFLSRFKSSRSSVK